MQMLYIPGLAMLRGSLDSVNEDQLPHTPLWLPSALPAKITCDHRLYAFEWDLRSAQADDALSELRQNLQLRSYLFKYKDRFATGQKANTRANASIARVQRNIKASTNRYRIARHALLSLAILLKKDSTSLPELQDEDVRGMTVGEGVETEGRRLLSWIWRRGGDMGTDDENLHECMYLTFETSVRH